MKYKFRRNWFAPTESVQINKVYTTSGRMYRKDKEYDLDEETAKLALELKVVFPDPVASKKAKPKEEPYAGLKQYDEARALDEEVSRRLREITDDSHKDEVVSV